MTRDLRHGLVLVLTAATAGGCGAGPTVGSRSDPYRDRPFATSTAADLRAGKLPRGYRLGDGAPVATADGERLRVSADPNETTLLVTARGSGSSVDLVQWVFRDSTRPPQRLWTRPEFNSARWSPSDALARATGDA
ncbi:MAG: hypothetical protein AB7I19_11595 [Planctomycetota bacterium]